MARDRTFEQSRPAVPPDRTVAPAGTDRWSPTLQVNLDDCDLPGDVIDALVLGPFIAGTQPWARIVTLARVRDEATLLPTEHPSRRTRRAFEQHRTSVLAEGDGWTLRAVRWRDGSATVTVSAVTEDLGERIVADATADAVVPLAADAAHVAMGFWHRGRHGPRRSERAIDVRPWADLRVNYNRVAGASLTRLMTMTAEDVTGRLLLLHGPPGTGKTTALRSLAHAWRDWCRLDYVLDPECLFKDSGYLLETALGEPGDDEPTWRLLILEDCDELIRSDAKQGAGQSLARLLNITDGLLGQGLQLIVALTTNEPIGRLHPAITRPGRCLAQIEVGPLSPAEANEWLGTRTHIDERGATLAELYQHRGEVTVVGRAASPHRTGQYL